MNIIAFSPYVTFPPDEGGKIRIYNINKNLSKNHKIIQHSYNLFRYKGKIVFKDWTNKITSNYKEYCHSNASLMAYSFFMHKMNLPAMAYFSEFLQLRKKNPLTEKHFDLVQINHPWLFSWIKKNNREKIPIAMDTQNVEYLFCKDPNYFLSKSTFRNRMLKKIFDVEKASVLNSDIVFSVSEIERKQFMDLYEADKNKIKVVPHGVHTDSFKPASQKTKNSIKKKLGLENKKIIFFVGNNHYPNVEAVGFIKKTAEEINDDNILFIVAGSVGKNFSNSKNITFTGYVQDILPYFQIADVALHPITTGTGVNLKILEYLSAGIPTISTRYGARGLELKNNKELIMAETIKQFTNSILEILENESLNKKLEKNSREFIVKNHSWKKIVEQVEKEHRKLIS